MILRNNLRSREGADRENGARKHKLQFHCALPQMIWIERRPSPSNLAHVVNGFQTVGNAS
jgi:hypothetical protein